MEVTYKEARDIMEKEGGIIIDVREENEVRALPKLVGAVNLPLSTFEIEDLEKYKNTNIFIICASGARASRLFHMLDCEAKGKCGKKLYCITEGMNSISH